MRKIILSIIISTIVIVVVFTAIYFLSHEKDNSRLSVLLADADNSIATGYYFKCEELLRRAMLLDLSPEKSLSLLKRVYRLAEATGKYDILSELGADARKRYSSSKEIAFIHSYALLKTGRPVDAYSAAAARVLDSFGENLRYESLLAQNVPIDDDVLVPESDHVPELALLHGNDPVLFLQAAEKLKDARLFLDAALLEARRGNIDSAIECIERASRFVPGIENHELLSRSDTSWRAYQMFVVPLMLLSYDAGQFERALMLCRKMIAEDPLDIDVRLIVADINLQSSKFDNAVDDYSAIIGLSPRYSSLPYLNLSRIMQNRNSPDRALQYLKNANEFFPESKEVTFELARAYEQAGDTDVALALLHNLLEKFPNDESIRVLLLEIEKQSLSVEGYRLRLWELFNSDHGNRLYASLLLSNLVLFEDKENAIRLIRIIEADGIPVTDNSRKSLLSHFRGILFALDGDNAAAIRFFDDALLASDNSVIRYNRAVCNMKAKRFNDAESDLWKLTKSGAGNDRSSSFLTRAEGLLAESKFRSGNIRDAILHAQRALEYDRGNLAAGKLLAEIKKSLPAEFSE